jgi:hypothetical protein
MVQSTEPRLPVKGDVPQKLADNVAIWTEIKSLADKFGCMSLGEGAPNLMPHPHLVD